MKLNEQIDFLINNCIATEEEVRLVMDITGRNEETINNILFARTGYRSIEQYLECEEEDWEV